MDKKIWIGIITALAVVAIVVFVATRKSEPNVIRIGVSLPLSGDAAVWGKSQKDGYDLAVEQINGKGGIKAQKVRLIYGDDTGLPKEGVSLLHKFIDIDQIDVLTGVANSSVALAFIPIIEKEKIVFVSSGASSPKLTGASKYFFRTWPSDIAEALAMAKYAYGEMKTRSVVVLYINNDYGIGLLEPFRKTFESLGGKVLSAESFEQGATNFRTQLTKLQSHQPEAIYLAGNPREMGRAIKQARELGIKTRFFSISTLNDPEVFSITGTEAIEGTVISDASFDPQSDEPAAKKFMADFRKMFDKDPGILANTAYDALMVIAHAIEEVGTNPDLMAEHLRNMKDYVGVSGNISFSEGGDINRPIRISQSRNGSFIKLIDDYRWY